MNFGEVTMSTITIELDPRLYQDFVARCEQVGLENDTALRRLVEKFVAGEYLLDEMELAPGITVGEYLQLSDEDEATLWDEWYAQAHEAVEHITGEVSPDAIPAG
jgi:hypothetical protein